MSVETTLVVAALAAIAAGVCGWLGARPAIPGRPPRLAPWRLLMLIAFAVMVTALGHLVAIWRGS
ncbi:MAG: hypothetical protein ABSD80_04880 [Caulobacteraceae bacterium]